MYNGVMTTATITRTKDYLVIKIPLGRLAAERKIDIVSEDQKASEEGLRAIADGRVSKKFRTARGAISFLRKL